MSSKPTSSIWYGEFPTSEADVIRDSNNCIGPEVPGYHKFAGDQVLMWDVDAGVIYKRNFNKEDRTDTFWETIVT